MRARGAISAHTRCDADRLELERMGEPGRGLTLPRSIPDVGMDKLLALFPNASPMWMALPVNPPEAR